MQQNPRFVSEILDSQKLDRGRVAKSKRLVAVAEEESRGGAIQLFLSPFLPSFTANHSCFTRRCKAVVGAYTNVVVH